MKATNILQDGEVKTAIKNYRGTDSPTYLLTLTHSLNHSLTYLLLLTHLLTYLLTHSLTYSYPLTHLLTYLLTSEKAASEGSKLLLLQEGFASVDEFNGSKNNGVDAVILGEELLREKSTNVADTFTKWII